ncbi:MAG: IS1634 family transposase [Woeseia sp.]
MTKKIIRGHAYYYARECKRVDGKPKIVWQKYLGRLDDIVSAVTEKRSGRQSVPQPERESLVTDLGAAAALYDLSRRLDLAGIIDRHVPKRGRGTSVGTYLLAATLNRCIAPKSKAQIGPWLGTTVLRRLLDVEPARLTSQRFWDHMDRVSAEAIVAIEADLARRLVTDFQLDLSRVLFDATNFFTFIDTFNDRSTLAQRGHSKEGRASLRLVGLALLVTADGHVPLFHQTYAGNQADAPTFASLSAALAARVGQLVEGVEHVTLVFDKGNNSEANLGAVDESLLHFVGSLVPTQHAELLEVGRETFTSLADAGYPDVSAYRTTKVVFGQPRTVLVTYNENLFVAQMKTLLREIATRTRKLGELRDRLERRRSGEIRGGHAPTLQGTRNAVHAILKGRHMKDLFEVKLTLEGKLPVLEYELRHRAWNDLQRTLLGKTILFTDNHDWTDSEIVHAYRAQHHIEDAFRDMKDPDHIAMRPQFHWTDQKVQVHVFTCVLALMLLSLQRRELAAKGFALSNRRMLELLGSIREIVTVFPPAEGESEPQLRTTLSAMSPEQRSLFDALELGRYTIA